MSPGGAPAPPGSWGRPPSQNGSNQLGQKEKAEFEFSDLQCTLQTACLAFRCVADGDFDFQKILGETKLTYRAITGDAPTTAGSGYGAPNVEDMARELGKFPHHKS